MPNDKARPMRLPIRLVPEKDSLSGALQWGVFVVIFLALATLAARGMILDPGPKLQERVGRGGSMFFGSLVVLVFGGCFIFTLKLTVGALLGCFPNSPYYYTEIGSENIAVRDGWGRRRAFRWSDLSRFTVGERIITLRSGDKVIEPWVVAQLGANAVVPEDRKLRRKRAAIRIDPKWYAGGEPEAVNREFADWLNAVRDQAIAGGIHQVDVPERFRESVRPAPPAGAAAATGVIQR